MPRAPLHDQGVTSLHRVSRTMSVGITPPSSLLRAHAPVLHPPLPRYYPWIASLYRLRSAPAGRRTFPTFSLRICPCVLGPLPRRLLRCTCPFLPPRQRPSPVRTGSALPHVRAATSAGRPFRGCHHSLMFRPAGVLTTQVAPPATAYAAWQPWFLRPSLSWFVTSPRPGYTNRPNRAIDGRGFSPHQMRSLVGCSPNAGRQARRAAGAQRTLEGVAWTPWLELRVLGRGQMLRKKLLRHLGDLVVHHRPIN